MSYFVLKKMDKDLFHHGIKGQKWGVRRFQNKDGTYTEAGKKRYRDHAEEGLATLAIGAGIGAAIGARATKKSYDKKHITLDEEECKRNGLKTLKNPDTIEQACENANPNRGQDGYVNNCTLCSMATVLRQRGLDVSAGPLDNGIPLTRAIGDCFTTQPRMIFSMYGTTQKFAQSRKDAEDVIKTAFKDGDFGVVSVDWINGGGHAFNWTLDKGKVSFYDGQWGRDDDWINKIWDKKAIDPKTQLIIADLHDTPIRYDYLNNRLKC